jgi:polyisoprenoid-binding protein YceI
VKKVFINLLIAGACFFTATQAAATAQTYIIDSSHSYVLWHINHFGFSNPSGKWMVQGTLVLDEKSPENAKVNITIPVANMDTGVAKLDEHLKSKDFFNVAVYPTASFVSTKVQLGKDNTAQVYGVLTLHGVSKQVVLDVKLNKMGVNPISNKKTAGFGATTQIKRSDFGITNYLPGLGDDVLIEIQSEAAVG